MIPLLALLLTVYQNSVPPRWGLLQSPAVQRELHFSASESRRVESIISAAKAKLAKLRASRPNVAAEAISYNGKVMQLAREDLEKFGSALSRQRQTRLREISLQERGPYLLDDSAVANAIGVSPKLMLTLSERQSKINVDYAIKVVDYAKAHNLPMVGIKGGGEIPKETPAIKRFDAERVAAIWRMIHHTLSADQNKRLSRLLGKPFRF